MALQVAEPVKAALTTRIVSGLVLAPVALVLVWLGGWYFAGLTLVAGVLMIVEWDRLCGGKGQGAHVWLLGVAVIASALLAATSNWLPAIATALVCTLVAAVLSQRERRSWTALGGIYVLLPILALLWIRGEADTGLLTIVWMLIVVWSTDTGAYFAGTTIGGPKMAPRLSPNKTWAGLAGGVICAALASVLIGKVADAGTITTLALFGVLAAVIGQIGDVCESSVKRHFGVKDSGTIIPGHGGLFDRLDSLLFVAVVVAAANLFSGKAMIWQ
jgi:phosphatidate cytidylyltransferase